MSLNDYNHRRRFDETPEPEGSEKYTNQNRFVVHRHEARKLHYDLRLEINGVLKCWAVPKGPSMSPSDRRLAVQTEDHPIQYLSFHGTIPKGNYGAGTMTIWDRGTFRVEGENPYQQWRNGDIKIMFFGNRLKGRFALVCTNGNDVSSKNWLMIKKKDGYEYDGVYDAEDFSVDRLDTMVDANIGGKIGNFIEPMLATQGKKIFNHPDWIYELKWDGYRMLAHIYKGKVVLYSRNGINYNFKFPQIVTEMEQMEHDAIIDGEVVMVAKNGLPDFQSLQNYPEHNENGSLIYYAFDLLYLKGIEMLPLPLTSRKHLLKEILPNEGPIRYCEHLEGMGTALYDKAKQAGMEGIIAKRADSLYRPGVRTENWLKLKEVQSEEFLICGYIRSEATGRPFGSLILGEKVHDTLRYIGNCGTGFSLKKQEELMEIFKDFKIDTSPFDENIDLKGRIPVWMRPELSCGIKFLARTSSGMLRQATFKGLRLDKLASENAHRKGGLLTSSTLTIDGFKVPFSNLDKILWPDEGIRKYDLIEYYLSISDTILPYLRGRPQSLHRHPNGILEKGFYQKDARDMLEWIQTYSLPSKNDRIIRYVLCENEATLLYLANLGCIELNPWHSKIENIKYPDYCIIDLDPGPRQNFQDVVLTAKVCKKILDGAGLQGYCKTSGSSGIHIYIPLGGKYTYPESRKFSELFCIYVHERLPDLTTMERQVKKRKGKLYLDHLQNRKGQTLAAPYCVRPRPNATVSAPITWSELDTGIGPGDFTISTMPKRIQKIGDVFKGLFTTRNDLSIAISNLEARAF